VNLRFASLGSGSRGTATLVQSGDTRLLLDCGFAMRELDKRCARVGVDLGEIDAVLVSHEHADHIKGVGPLARKYGVPVWMTHGTWRNARCGDIPQLRLFSSHSQRIEIGDIRVKPFPVPHDAREPSQFVFSHQGLALGILTDAGSLTPHLVSALNGVDALLLECNHDLDMLKNGPYPPRLQARVSGDYGHLSNAQAADLLTRIDNRKLQHIVIGHISEKNNTPELAVGAVLQVAQDLESRMKLLVQDDCSNWYQLAS